MAEQGIAIVMRWFDQGMGFFLAVIRPSAARVRPPNTAEQLARGHVIHETRERHMKALIAAIAFAAMPGPAIAQNTGPAPQTGMERPENTNGATERGAMDTTGMNVDRANQPETNDASRERKTGDKKKPVGGGEPPRAPPPQHHAR